MSDDVSSDHDKSEEVKGAGWDSLPNELLTKIIAHAVSTPAWEANKTLSSLSLTSRHIHRLTQSNRLDQYKNSLDGGRILSGEIKDFAAPGGEFSDRTPWHDNRDIGKEVDALGPALEFQSPSVRSQIVGSISTKEPNGRMLGYDYLLDHENLLKKSEVTSIEHDVMAVFQNSQDTFEYDRAEWILAKRYDHIGEDARDQIKQTISTDLTKEKSFNWSRVCANPSLLRDDDIKSFVREKLLSFEDANRYIVDIASHFDKNLRADTDFIIDASFKLWREESAGDEIRFPYPARAIAKVFDGNISDEQRQRIEATRRSDTEEGRALTAAFNELGREPPAEQPVAYGLKQSLHLALQLGKVPSIVDPVAAIEAAGEISKTNASQVNAARKALLDSVTERDGR